MPSTAEDYLESALCIMQANALHRDQIDWQALRFETFQRAAGASTPAETYESIRWALRQLNDGHSFFEAPVRSDASIALGGHDHNVMMPSGHLRPDQIAYLQIPGFRASTQLGTRYVDVLHSHISQFDAADPIGWMVDLTENGGGNMWPMLAGLGPLLGEGPLGSFRFPGNPPAIWRYHAGHSLLDDLSLAHATGSGYLLSHSDRPVALLASQKAASSAEAVLIAFVGLPNARRFGTATRGLTTSNDEFPLSDGAAIFLTVATFVDRLGQVYGQANEPQYYVGGDQKELLKNAADWVQRHSNARI